MSSRRPARIASVIHEEVARRLLTAVKDPRVGSLSVTGVTVNPDLTVAIIRYLPLGGVGNRALIQAALTDASYQLRGPVGRALGTRHAPELRFELDKNIEYAAHMDEVFARLPKPAEDEPGVGPDEGSPAVEADAPEADGAASDKEPS